MRRLVGLPANIMAVLCTILCLFHLYSSYMGSFAPFVQRGVHFACLLPLAFFLYPASPKSDKKKPTAIDYVLALLAILPSLYVVIEKEYLQNRIAYVTPVKTIELVLGTLLIVLVLEAVRRSVSQVMAGLVFIFLLYLPFGKYLPGVLYHSGMNFKKLIEAIYMTTGEGVYGMLMNTSATQVVMFIIFGSFVFAIGAGEFFTDFARMVAGSSRGGPAKIATLSSCLFGTLTGSAVANVYATGTFSIPLMKKCGFKPEFAGAVEAAASTGGQIMPPIMGAAAFIMADNLSMPYIKVALAALIPAVLYYYSLWMMIEFRCRRDGNNGEDKANLPKWRDVSRRMYLFLPIAILFTMLCLGYSPLLACFSTIALCFALSFLKKETWMTPQKLVETFVDAGGSACMVAVALAGAGIIVVAVTKTGFALTLGSMILSLSHNIPIIALTLIAIVTIIFGMGMPTTASYVIAAALAASSLIQLGINPVATHLFILYFAVISNITPPVAIAAYAGANIAESDPMKTGIEAFIVAMAGYLVPFIFVFSPVLVLQEATGFQIAQAAISATIGVTLMAAGIQGFFLTRLNGLFRVVLIASALLLIYPGTVTDIAGIFVAAAVSLIQVREKSRTEVL
ncbi:MAG: TRAP transporter permease [bacterium]|nr:TRAP transporter permease [bacterium]